MIYLTQAQADRTVTSLTDAGFAGAILAVLVAPVLLVLVKGAQKRQEASDAREEKESSARQEREGRLVSSLTMAVDQQRAALEQWRIFELEEKQTHTAILATLGQMTQTLANIAERIKNP